MTDCAFSDITLDVQRECIFMPLLSFAPVLRSVCNAWRVEIAKIPEQIVRSAIYSVHLRGLTGLGYINILKWAREQNKKPFSADYANAVLYDAAFNGHLDCMNLAFEWGAREYSRAILHAVQGDQLTAMEILIERGGHIDGDAFVASAASTYEVFEYVMNNHTGLLTTADVFGAIMNTNEHTLRGIHVICNSAGVPWLRPEVYNFKTRSEFAKKVARELHITRKYARAILAQIGHPEYMWSFYSDSDDSSNDDLRED